MAGAQIGAALMFSAPPATVHVGIAQHDRLRGSNDGL